MKIRAILIRVGTGWVHSRSAQVQGTVEGVLREPEQAGESAPLLRRLRTLRFGLLSRTAAVRALQRVLHPQPVVHLLGLQAHDVALVDDLVYDEHDVLQVVEDELAGVGPGGDQVQHVGDGVDDLLHQHEVLVVGGNQEDLKFVDHLEEDRVGVEGEDLG